MRPNFFKKYLAAILLISLSLNTFSFNVRFVLANSSSTIADVPTPDSITEQMKDKPAKERAQIKAQAIANSGIQKGDEILNSQYGVKIKIHAIEVIDGGIQVFAQAWDKSNRQYGFGANGSVDIERFRIFNPPIRVPDGTTSKVPGFDPRTQKEILVDGLNYKEDPRAALFESLAHTIAIVGRLGSNIKKGKVGNTTDIFYPDAHTESTSFDGRTQRTDGNIYGWTHTQVRNQSSSNSQSADSDATITVADYVNAGSYIIGRMMTLFDTSPIVDNDTITSATLSLYKTNTYGDVNDDSTSLRIVTVNTSSTTGVSDSDYGAFTTTAQASDKTLSSFTLNAYNNFALNATGISNISKTGITKFGARLLTDINDSAPSGTNVLSAASADTGGTTNDPKLIVEHSLPLNPEIIQSLSYTYDSNGNITRIVDSSETNTAKTTDFTYDDLNRLTYASTSNATSGLNYAHTYNYNALGNITSSTPAGTYVYGSSTYANPHAATAVSSTIYSYDTNGNLTSDSTWTHTWDYRNRLTQSTKTGATSTYAYDHTNTRVKMTTASSTLIEPSANYSTENGTAVKHIYANGQLVATIRGSGASSTLYAIHTDHLGSLEKTTDSSSTIVELTDYYPYGSQRQNTGSLDDRKGYIGKDTDTDTGLSQLEARYYKSSVGRFMSQDPLFWNLPMEYLIDPQQQNSYSYARNNPITFSDPTGNATLMQSFLSAVQTFLNSITSFFGGSNSNSSSQTQAPKPSPSQVSAPKSPPTPAPRTTTWDPVTDQRIKRLDSRVQQPATNFVNNTESQAGVQLRVTTGYRSIEEQNRLYNQGRTTPGNVVTNARGGQSYHNYGRAIDVVIMEDGQPNWQKRIDDNVANIGAQQGFSWGGNWSGGFQDYPHFEMPLGQKIRDLMR